MEKDSVEKDKKKINFKKELVAILIIIVFVLGINFLLSHINIQNDQKKDSNLKVSKTIENQKLVIKSNSDYNKIIEYTFENNIVKTVKIYEQFDEEQKFEEKIKNYESVKNIEIIKTNEQELSIEIEKKDFGSDTGKTYEEIYDKYAVQIIGAYEVIK